LADLGAGLHHASVRHEASMTIAFETWAISAVFGVQLDPVALKRKELRAAVAHILKKENRPGLSLDQIEKETSISRQTLWRLKFMHGEIVIKLARWKRFPHISKLAQELLALMGCPPGYIDSIALAPREGSTTTNIIKFRPRPTSSRRPEKSARPMFRHMALQLHATDFDPGALEQTAFNIPNPDLGQLEEAAFRDLLMTYIDARYFCAFAQAIRADRPIPRHPYNAYRLEPFLYPDKIKAYHRKLESHPQGSALKALCVPETFVFHGRDPSVIFKPSLGKPPADSFDAFIADATATGVADRFPTHDSEAHHAIVDRVKEAARSRDFTLLYRTLTWITDFEDSDWVIPQKKLLMAAASCAAIRAELATLHAAYTMRLMWADDPVHSGRPVFALASKLFELCHATHLLTNQQFGEALKHVPKPKQHQYVSDREQMAGQFMATLDALTSDQGVWFFFGHEERGLPYLSRNGSIFQTDIIEEDGGRIKHRFITHEESLVPERFVRGDDRLYSFRSSL
jgi:hypothetical protein